MNLSQLRYINVNGEKMPFKLGMKANILYEKFSGKSFYSMTTGIEDILTMVYCAFAAGHSLTDKEFNITFDNFLALVDDNPTMLDELKKIMDEEQITVELESAKDLKVNSKKKQA